jgi:O-antigen/teichoic acid export membrane protein
LKSSRRAEALVILVLFLLPLLWFAPQALGNKTLLPADNLYQYPPWSAYAQQMGLPIVDGKVVPYNHLISDLVLENLQWKSVVVDALRSGNLGDVLWNPRAFAGVPFFAAGQYSAAYPLSILFYVLPLARAYGVFTWLQVGLAAVAMYVFMRTLRVRPIPAALSGIAFAFSGFYIVSVNFTMVIAAAAWLPLLLACIEMIVRGYLSGMGGRSHAAPWVALGAVFLAIQIFAGHVEITYYTLMVAGFYAAWRLAGVLLRQRSWRQVAGAAGWMLAMIVLGMTLGGAQILPLYELVTQSFREGSASLQQVQDWAWPSRQIVTFLLPDFYGNPTHHEYFDIWQRTWVPVTKNALGETLTRIDWGVKNYVEGGNYLGILTLLLALTGAVAGIRRWGPLKGNGTPHLQDRRQHSLLFATLAVLSLLFAFGTPLYALLYYGLPGYSQLHSAFRWVYPYTLAMAALAGFGLDWLLSRPAAGRWLPRILGWLSVAVGAGSLALVLTSIFMPGPFTALGERLLDWGFWADIAKSQGFADGAIFWSYEAVQIARFGLMALLSGVAILLLLGVGRDARRASSVLRIVSILPLVVLTLDLWLVGHSFNPAVDPKLLDLTPPSVAFLQSKLDPAQPWRVTSFDDAEREKVMNANSTMRYGIEDIRGYDSIIPKQYVAYMKRIHPQGELLYNRIAPIYSELGGQRNDTALDNPLLHLLGARYVVSTQPISNAGYNLVYDDEVRIYENANAFPRAFIAGEAVAAGDQEAALDRLQQVDARNVVVVEGLADGQLPPPSSPQLREVQFSNRESREFFVDVNISDRGWLVVTENYFDGWKAYLRPFGVTGEGVNESGESIETQLPIYRANGTFRAVYLPEAGQWTVRFVYSPRSVLLGVYLSFLSVITLILLLGWWAWGRFYKGEGSEVGTVAKNSTVQVVMSLMNRAIDFAFAMLRLRVLSPEGEGSYVTAIAFYLIAEIVTRFGLGTLLTRDVAFDKSRARKYLWNVISLRSLLWLVSLPVMAGVLYFFQHSPTPLTSAEVQAIALFAAALFFANIADALSSVFMAFEKMEYPAANATVITVAKVALGGLVLLPPFSAGFVGLAAVSVGMNFIQVIWLWVTLEKKVLRPHEAGVAAEVTAEARGSLRSTSKRLDWSLQRYMLRESGPLMINHLLATVFWRISQLVLRAAVNPAAVGIFSAGIKYVDGLNVIPAYFTAAIFPLMSRYAQSGSEAFVKAYRLALQLLFIVALPIAVFFTFEATTLIRILGGAAYLPESAIVLRVMIWSIPIGFINSVTQYALIAVNQQRYLTRAFVVGVAFTAISNWLLVPRFGAVAAAALLIPAELSLFIPFARAVHRYIAPMPWVGLLGRPLLATAVNLAIVWGLERAGLPTMVAVAAGFTAYVAVLFILGAFRGDEFAVLRNSLNRRLHRPAAESSA